MATERAGKHHPQSLSSGVASLLLNVHDRRVNGDRGLLDAALAFANGEAEPREHPNAVAWRGELREALSQYRREPEALYERLRRELRDDLDDVRIVPDWWFGVSEGRRVVKRFDEVVPASWRALLAYLVMLLFEDGEELGSDLCQCQLESCGRYFLAIKPKTGRPRRDYHEKKCMLEAHALGSKERVQRSRAKRARKAK